MKIYWSVWCEVDPEWRACGTVDTVDSSGRDHGPYWGHNQAAFMIHEARIKLQDRLGVEPPGVRQAWAFENCPDPRILAAARGEIT